MNYAPQVNTGTHGEYYTINGYHYDIHFPLSWALDPEVYARTPDNKVKKFKTGPQYCSTCNYFGSFRGVFICYCAWCARNLFEYERGGNIGKNDEEKQVFLIQENVDLIAYPHMKSATLDEIGSDGLEQPPHEEFSESDLTNVTCDHDNILTYYNNSDHLENNNYEEDEEEREEQRRLGKMERAISRRERNW